METIPLSNEIKMHRLGIERMLIGGSTLIKDKKTLELSNKIIEICRNAGITYEETLKAIIHADDSLYYRSKVNDTNAH